MPVENLLQSRRCCPFIKLKSHNSLVVPKQVVQVGIPDDIHDVNTGIMLPELADVVRKVYRSSEDK